MPSELDGIQKAVARAIHDLFTLADLWEGPDAITVLSAFYQKNMHRVLHDPDFDWKTEKKGYTVSDETIMQVTTDAILSCLDLGRRVNLYRATQGHKPVSFLERALEKDKQQERE